MLNPNATAFYEYFFHISCEGDELEWNGMECEMSTFWALENQANNDTWTQTIREENVALKTIENNTYWPSYSP